MSNFDRFEIDGVHAPAARPDPLEWDEQPDVPQFFHALLAVLILGLPVLAAIVAMVWLTQVRFFS